jgi:C-terminal processing protease CtpA/Prc
MVLLRRERLPWPGLALALLAALPIPARAQASSCSALGQVAYVRDAMRDLYYWYRELPDPNPALFDSPEAYLEAVRYRPLDTSFSYIGLKATEQAFYSDSQFIGFGFGSKLLAEDDLRITQVFSDSPASEAGLERGTRILEIGGRSVADLVRTGEIATAFGPGEIGFSLTIRVSDRGEREVTFAKRLVTIPTVSHTRFFDVEGRRVGYVFFRNFVQPSVAALDAAFAELKAAGATDLVLDLRYNGGGLVSVAQHLGGLIGGLRTTGQVFAQFIHNDKNSFRNQVYLFPAAAAALDVPRVVLVTTRASASASEGVINALRPFLDVKIVGDRTYGKPVGQYGLEFCEKVLYPVAFTLRNARGEGDYFDGLPADCAAADDLDHLLGDPAEGSLAEALHVVARGTCSGQAAGARTQLARPLPRIAVTGWQQLVGAH